MGFGIGKLTMTVKSVIFIFICGLILQGSALAQKIVTVKIGSQAVKPAQPAMRDGERCLMPLVSLPSIGWGAAVNSNGKTTIKINAKTITAPVIKIGGIDTIDLAKAVSQLGGFTEWNNNQTEFTLSAPMPQLKFDKTGVGVIETAIPVFRHVFHVVNPDRIVVDLYGILPSKSTPKSKLSEDIKKIRFGDADSSVYRIVLDMAGETKLTDIKDAFSASTALAWKCQPLPPAEIGEAKWDISAKDNAVITLPINRKVPASIERDNDPNTVTVILPYSQLKAKAKTDVIKHDLITKLSIEQTTPATANVVKLVINLGKTCGVNVTSDIKNLRIAFVTPSGSGGKLADKIIVVDPGHGGYDSGASTSKFKSRTGGKVINEKDINLAIGKKLSDKLTALGATVVMTRCDDTFITIGERYAIANRNKADLFISVHANASDTVNKRSGTAVYYYDESVSGTALAEALQYEIGKSIDIKNDGMIPDRNTRFGNSGFGVLRGTNMPAVLLESGFIDHDTDREKLLNAKWQDSYVSGVIFGLKRYVGEPLKRETFLASRVGERSSSARKPNDDENNKPKTEANKENKSEKKPETQKDNGDVTVIEPTENPAPVQNSDIKWVEDD